MFSKSMRELVFIETSGFYSIAIKKSVAKSVCFLALVCN